MDEFKETLKMYITIDDEIRKLKKVKIKEFKKIEELIEKREKITPIIIKFMKDNNLQYFTLDNIKNKVIKD